MSENISRRQALKQMALASVGIATAGTVLESCAGSSSKAGSANVEMEAPEGTKVVTRSWNGLGQISLLGLGCMRFPTLPATDQTMGHNAPLDQAQINDMVDYAIAHGINYFDTAPAYGESEKATGIALSRFPRESYYIATKMSNFAWGPQVPTLEAAVAMFENSLANLQTDYVDFMLLHAISDEASFKTRFIDNGVLDFLIEKRKEGVIRHLGFSYHGNNADFDKILDNYYDWEFVQIQMNYADWKNMPSDDGTYSGDTSSKYEYEALVKRNIPAVVMEPIKGGALANVSDAIKTRLADLHPDLSPAGCALTFVGTYPDVMVTLSGMSNMAQLKENIATFTSFREFSQKEIDEILEVGDLYNANMHIPCTGCSYCQPCPNGVNIPGNFKVFNTTSDELNIPDASTQTVKEFKKKAKILLTRYRKDLADGARADACTKCNICIPKCPQHIRIPDQLKMIRDLVDNLG